LEMAVYRLFAKGAIVGYVTTSGFRFRVGHDLNRSTCSGDCLGNAYFRSTNCRKSEKFGTCHFGRIPMGLAEAVTFFSKKQKVGKEAVNCSTLPRK